MKRTPCQLLSMGLDLLCLSWGCVASCGTGNITEVDGRMESSKYHQILEAYVTESIKKLTLKRDWLLH